MGQVSSSGCLHKWEHGLKDNFPVVEFTPQPQEEVVQLDTEVDQRGNTTVDHVFKRIRDVYGQQARDMKRRQVEWSEYMTPITNRPSPYDFPAFEHEEKPKKMLEEAARKQSDGGKTSRKAEKTNSLDSLKSKEKSKDSKKKKSKSKKTQMEKESDKKKEKGSKEKDKSKSKDKKKGGKKERRISANQELDHCSLEE